MYKKRYIEILILLICVFSIFFYYFFGNEGYYGWDDMEYAKLSYNWAKDNFDISDNHFSYRIPIIFFTGIFYKLFGVTDFVSALPAIIISIILLLLIYIVVYHNDTRVVITALVVTTFMPYFIRYSHKLMVDIYVTFGIFASFVSLFLYKFRYKKLYILLGSLFSIFLFIAFLAKETVVLISPLLLLLIIVDLLKRQNVKFWFVAVITGVTLLIAYHLIIWKITGSPFSRYYAIEKNMYLNTCSYEFFPFLNTLKRIIYEFWNEIILSGLAFLVVFAVSKYFCRTKLLDFARPESYWLNISIISLLLCNFMTKSYKAYSPMCLDMRHYLFLIPMFAVASAPVIVRYFYSIKHNFIASYFILLISIVYFLQVYFQPYKYLNGFYITVAIFTVIAILKLFLKKHNYYVINFLFVFFLLSWLAFYGFQIVNNKKNVFSYIKPFIDKNFVSSKKSLVLCDPILKRISDYYMLWDSTNVRFINERSPDIPYYDEKVNYLVYKNDITWWHLRDLKIEPMLLWYLKEQNVVLVDSFKGNYLYKIEKPENVFRIVDTLSFYDNGETFNKFFTSCNKDSFVKFSGNCSYKIDVKGFSPTLVLRIGDIVKQKTHKLEIEISGMVLYKSKLNSNVVLALEDSTGITLFWLGKPLYEIIKPSIFWQNFTHRASYVLRNANDKNLLLKVYLWNNDENVLWLDDFRIKIYIIDCL
jgi:4-amino-4-deoxy-L-arabinose transferase-like glycosyltransferase